MVTEVLSYPLNIYHLRKVAIFKITHHGPYCRPVGDNAYILALVVVNNVFYFINQPFLKFNHGLPAGIYVHEVCSPSCRILPATIWAVLPILCFPSPLRYFLKFVSSYYGKVFHISNILGSLKCSFKLLE